jgi:hypothetical protein
MDIERYRLDNPALAGIMDRVALIRAYQAIVDGLLAGRSATEVQVLNVGEERLVIGVTSAAAASRLRFEAPDLLERLHRALDAHPGAPKPARIVVRVTPPPANPVRSTHRQERPPSPAASAALHHLAESQRDDDLARALERLSKAVGSK